MSIQYIPPCVWCLVIQLCIGLRLRDESTLERTLVSSYNGYTCPEEQFSWIGSLQKQKWYGKWDRNVSMHRCGVTIFPARGRKRAVGLTAKHCFLGNPTVQNKNGTPVYIPPEEFGRKYAWREDIQTLENFRVYFGKHKLDEQKAFFQVVGYIEPRATMPVNHQPNNDAILLLLGTMGGEGAPNDLRIMRKNSPEIGVYASCSIYKNKDECTQFEECRWKFRYMEKNKCVFEDPECNKHKDKISCQNVKRCRWKVNRAHASRCVSKKTANDLFIAPGWGLNHWDKVEYAKQTADAIYKERNPMKCVNLVELGEVYSFAHHTELVNTVTCPKFLPEEDTCSPAPIGTAQGDSGGPLVRKTSPNTVEGVLVSHTTPPGVGRNYGYSGRYQGYLNLRSPTVEVAAMLCAGFQYLWKDKPEDRESPAVGGDALLRMCTSDQYSIVTPTGKSVPRAPYLKDAEPIKPWGKIATSLLAAISPRNDQDGTSDATGNDDAEPSPSSNFLN